jgi:aminoglycoside phosphotransferase (APT) family kinase protein
VGPLLASGRDADIFDYGPKLVLRRSRTGKPAFHEAQVMEYLKSNGYPVPAVEEVNRDGTDLIMERINGPSMVGYLSGRPWKVRQQGKVLAALHLRLHEIPAPPFLPPAPIGEGDQFVHMDLHPLNVMVADHGPVVIDWTNAARGEAAIDVAIARVLISVGEVPTKVLDRVMIAGGRALLVSAFTKPFDCDRIDSVLRQVVQWKIQDPHMSASEVRSMWRVVEKYGAASA